MCIKISLVVTVIMLCSCATQQSEPRVGNQTLQNQNNHEQTQEESAKVEIPVSAIYDQPQPVTSKPIAATNALLEQAEKLYEQGNYHKAIAVSERLLRINRTNAAVYILLAKAHLANGMSGLSTEFARQGLIFARQAWEKEALNQLLNY